jgi:hypothetical protein
VACTVADDAGLAHDRVMRSRRRPVRTVVAASALLLGVVGTAVIPAGPAGAVVERTPLLPVARLVSAFGSTPATLGPRDLPGFSDARTVSNDGRFVLFTTADRGSNDKNDVVDVYLRDLSDGSTSLVSHDRGGNAVGGRAASMGPDARFVAFVTSASLVAGDTGGDDVYVFDRRTGTYRLGNRAPGGPVGLVPTGRAQVSNDGNVVAWAGGGAGGSDRTAALRHRDGTTLTVPLPGWNVRGLQLTGDGRYLFVNADGTAWRVNTVTGNPDVVSDVSMSPSISACEISISYDGSRAVVTACAGGVYVWNAANPGMRPALTLTPTGWNGVASISGDGRFVTFLHIEPGNTHWRRADLVTGVNGPFGGGIGPFVPDPPELVAVPETSGDGLTQAVVSRSSVLGQTTSEATRMWAISASTVPGSTTKVWVTAVYRQVLGRVPTAAEVGAAETALAEQRRTAPLLVQDLLHTPSTAAPRGPMIRLYQAFFLRAPDNGGYDYWVGQRVAGRSLVSIASQFAASTEFRNRYGSLTNRQFVDVVYENVLGRLGDAGGRAYWTNQLDTRTATRGSVMVGFSESGEYTRSMANQVDYVMGAKAARGVVPSNAELAAARLRWQAGVSVTSDLRDLFDVT